MKRLLARQSYIIAGALALGLVVWMLTGLRAEPDGSQTEARDDALARAESLTRVRVRDFHSQPVAREIVINGRTEPNRVVQVRAETDGRVVELGVQRGSPVEAGDIIARVDIRDRRARLAEARALVNQRELEYEAANKLRDKEFFSRTRAAEAQAALEAARAAVRRIELDIAHTTIRAPFDGVLQERAVELGDFLDVGNVVATVVDNRPLIVSGEISEQRVAELSVDDAGTARLVTGETIEGRVRYVAARADEDTRTFRVELLIPNPDGRLRAGVTTEVRVSVDSVQAHFLSPGLLALNDAGAIGVKAVDAADVVRFHPVDIIRSSTEGIWVSGLPASVRLITVGQGFVRAGEVVKPVAESGEVPGMRSS